MIRLRIAVPAGARSLVCHIGAADGERPLNSWAVAPGEVDVRAAGAVSEHSAAARVGVAEAAGAPVAVRAAAKAAPEPATHVGAEAPAALVVAGRARVIEPRTPRRSPWPIRDGGDTGQAIPAIDPALRILRARGDS